MTATLTIAPMQARHWPEVEAIYAAGIATGHATFEATTPTWEAFDNGHLPDHRHVCLDSDGSVLGWAAVSPVSARAVYAGVVEHSVYVAPAARGRGVGRALLDELIRSTEAAGIWTIQSSVFPENTASLALHRAAGFRQVGVRRRIARMTAGPLAGQWRDTILLERRSGSVSESRCSDDGVGGPRGLHLGGRTCTADSLTGGLVRTGVETRRGLGPQLASENLARSPETTSPIESEARAGRMRPVPRHAEHSPEWGRYEGIPMAVPIRREAARVRPTPSQAGQGTEPIRLVLMAYLLRFPATAGQAPGRARMRVPWSLAAPFGGVQLLRVVQLNFVSMCS